MRRSAAEFSPFRVPRRRKALPAREEKGRAHAAEFWQERRADDAVGGRVHRLREHGRVINMSA
jgi:hypothetical protein